jgi:hypothetical protein
MTVFSMHSGFLDQSLFDLVGSGATVISGPAYLYQTFLRPSLAVDIICVAPPSLGGKHWILSSKSLSVMRNTTTSELSESKCYWYRNTG